MAEDPRILKSGPILSSSSSSKPSLEKGEGRLLQFAPFQSAVDEGFWHKLSALKLDKLRLDESPIQITGFYAPCSHAQVSNHLTLLAESLPPDSHEQLSSTETIQGNRNKCPVPGILYNTNTLESFRDLDRQNLLKMEANKIWDDICSGKAEEDPALLSRFLLISFADLKKWSFHYWFAFPALSLDPPATLLNLQPASQCFSREEAESLSAACNEWRNSSISADVPFFLISIAPNACATVRPLKDWEVCQQGDQKILFGFYDPCHLSSNPGWPLRNFLVFICLRWKLEKIHFLCYREKHGLADLGLSLVGEALVSLPEGWKDPQCIPKAVGWELNRGKLTPKCINLARSMDPTRLAISAADLNLKLMRWRTLPSLNLDTLSNVKCLLLGAGTLGCQVARMLMAWGVRKITLLDSGRVAMSNPLRQSLYTLEDCLNGGDLKSTAAVRSLKRIFPAVEAEGVALAIPMPGHPVPLPEEASVLDDCKHLENLIRSHDVTFLLTDTRESRWLPTLLCASANKVSTVLLALNTWRDISSAAIICDGASILIQNLCLGKFRLLQMALIILKICTNLADRSLNFILFGETSEKMIAITAALGFDSFLVMRHGAGPNSSMPYHFDGDGDKGKPEDTLDSLMEKLSTADGDGRQRLGCYFCNDVVAPIDSTSNRTLDQQCTVTRPGLAPIASALAVELLVGILHHPDGIYARGEIFDSSNGTSSEQPLGILPHQIRGFLSQFSQLTLVGYSSNSCTACSSTVVSEYRRRGMEFVLQAINQPSYLEDVTGLTELMKSANSFVVDWDNDDDYDI